MGPRREDFGENGRVHRPAGFQGRVKTGDSSANDYHFVFMNHLILREIFTAEIAEHAEKKSKPTDSSFRRKPESRGIIDLDPGFRRGDDFCRASLKAKKGSESFSPRD
jgi:hypothetical protein